MNEDDWEREDAAFDRAVTDSALYWVPRPPPSATAPRPADAALSTPARHEQQALHGLPPAVIQFGAGWGGPFAFPIVPPPPFSPSAPLPRPVALPEDSCTAVSRKLLAAMQVLSDQAAKSSLAGSMVALPLAAHIRVIDLLNSALDELSMPASELAMSPPPPPSPPSPLTEAGSSLPPTIAFGSHEPMAFPRAKPAISSIRGVNPRLNASLGVVDDNAAFAASSSAPSAPADFAPRGGIARLPSEILLIIFSSIFQGLAKDSTTPELFAASSNAEVRTDNGYGGVRLDSIPRSSPEIAQAYVLKLRLVCKSWDTPAATVGLRSIRIRTGLALYHLVKQLASPSHNALPCTCIESLDVHVLAEPDTRATGTLYDVYSSSAVAPLEDGQPGQPAVASALFGQLVSKASNLRALRLRMLPDRNGRRYHGDFADFLEAPIFTALTNASSLESLSLLIAVDFEELESIMRVLPNLQKLAVSEVDDLSGTGAISSMQAHPASRLHSICIAQVSYRRGNPTTLQPAQLCWLFEPAVASGKLEEVRLRMSGDYAQGGQAEGPPSTSGLFADLLARCGTRLKKLELTDQAAMMAVHSSLAAPPHNGDLDFALSYLHSLTRLALDWSFIGPAFLATVSTISTLESLDLLGTPVHTDSALFTASLELAFPSLRHLTLRGDLTGASNRLSRRTVPAAIVGNNWTGSTIRAIKRIAETRGLECIVENHRRVGW